MKRIYRSRRERLVAGVAGGLAEYFDVDPTIVRLVWVVLLLPGGLPGLLAYLACWIIIPEEPEPAGIQPPAVRAESTAVEPAANMPEPPTTTTSPAQPPAAEASGEDRPPAGTASH